jgi:TATA box binding protein associated factor (TAF)
VEGSRIHFTLSILIQCNTIYNCWLNYINFLRVYLGMSLLPKDSIKIISEAVGVTNLPDEVAAAMASDVEYRIREITQVFLNKFTPGQTTINIIDKIKIIMILFIFLFYFVMFLF